MAKKRRIVPLSDGSFVKTSTFSQTANTSTSELELKQPPAEYKSFSNEVKENVRRN